METENVVGAVADPIELPASLPVNSAMILADFARRKRPWSTEVFRAVLTFAGYGYSLVGEKAFGTVAPLTDDQAADELETALAVKGEGAAPGGPVAVLVVSMLVEWALKKLLERLGV